MVCIQEASAHAPVTRTGADDDARRTKNFPIRSPGGGSRPRHTRRSRPRFLTRGCEAIKCATIPMPIYVYGCKDCGATEEHIQRFSDDPLTECSTCGGRLEKQITSAAFHLKGGGWYKDGYASSKSDGEGGGAEASSSSGSDSSASSSDGGSSSSSDSGGSSSSSSSSSSGSDAKASKTKTAKSKKSTKTAKGSK